MMSEIVNNKVTDPVVVSISCITYNHAPYIRQCLDGFMMQQTNFAFEVLIHDDASTDGTTEIIKEYEAKYPDIIKPIYEEENQWVKGRRGSAVFNFPRAKGKYIALCEGDDYWTDPLKLQKQVDFLEMNLEYVVSSHNYNSYYQNSNRLSNKLVNDNDGQEYDLNFLILGGWLYQPLTLLFRRSAINLPKLLEYNILMDAVLIYHILQNGKGYYLNEIMAVYRVHDYGVWSCVDMDTKLTMEYEARLSLYDVERSDDAAKFILTQFTKQYGRRSWIKNYKLILKSLRVIRKHFGLNLMINIIFNKIVLGKEYSYPV